MSSFERQNFSDQLNIETPEQVSLQFSVAGIGSRFVAILLDKLILLAFCIVLFLVGLIFLSAMPGTMEKMNTASKWFIALVIFIIFLIGWGYFGLFEAYWQGQTPGKRAMKIRVIQDSGRQITLFESLARNLVRYIDYLPAGYLVGLITMVCNQRSKRLGDFVAGTLVVHERTDEQPMLAQTGATLLPRSVNEAWQPEPWQQAIPAMFPADAVAKLSAQDLVVIETFFGRALDLSIGMRLTMAERVARQMTAKMGVELPPGNPERALESIATAMRGSGRSFR